MLLGKRWGKKLLAALLCTTMLLGMTACGGNPQNTETEKQSESSSSEAADNTQNSETESESETTTEDEGDGNVVLDVTPSTEAGNPLPFRILSANEMVAEMGTGWNLGNTMDGHSGHIPNETLWQDDKTTQALIDAVHDLGFNTVRIPTTWGEMINDDNSINDKWMSRVQDIVDYCIAQDMYVIINLHHDGADQSGWLDISTKDLDKLYEKFGGVWNSIATRFKDYDEHLIFESMNEVYSGIDKEDAKEKGFDSPEAYDNYVIMQLNQTFVNVVRSSGSNNEQRWLSVPGRYTNIEIMTNEKYGFQMPADSIENRLFAAVHYYDWSFGMLESLGTVEFKESAVTTFANDIQKVVDKFTSKGIPVIMGEYGAINKNNPAQRAYHNEVMNLIMKQGGVVPVYWDQGWYDRSQTPADYSFTLVDRKTYKSIEKEVTDALIRGYFVAQELNAITVSPKVTEISKVTLAEDKATITIGDVYKVAATVEPANTNDVLLWKTADPNVATVYNGMIRARGIGTTTITAFAQSGSVKKTIEVTVNPVASTTPVTAINVAVEKGAYTLEEGTYTFINTVVKGGDEKAYLTYAVKNPEVATVSKVGKLTAIAAGETELVITSSDGFVKTVKVTVTEKVIESKLKLALHVLYNNPTLAYYGTEIGDVIEITEDGQYTLSFDFGTQASADAIAAGITDIQNLTAIYIKDYAVTLGELEKSNLNACFIRWDKIVVDGTDLTINNSEFKSAIKASGIFDTNDPFNSWDGSAVDEVTVDSSTKVLTINLDNPQKVTITFTIQGLEFAE